MNPFMSLLKVNLNNNFGISALKYRFTKEKKKRWEPLLIGISIIVGIGSILSLYIMLLDGLYAASKAFGHPELLLTMSFILTQLLILFFGMFYVMSSFYFSKDFNLLVPLPLKPYEVLGSKFLTVMANEYITVLPLLVPPLIIYGAGMNEGLLYWLKGILLIITTPAIPLAAGSLFVITLMRIVNLRKSKDLLVIIGGTLGIGLVVSLNFLMQRIPKGSDSEFFKEFVTSQTKLIETVGQKFPPAIWATLGLSDHGAAGWLNLLLFIGLSVLLFIFFLWLGNLVFYKGLLAGQESSAGRASGSFAAASSGQTDAGNIGSAVMFRRVAARSPVKAIYIREWKLLMKTPMYFLNGFIGNIIGPIIVLVMFTAQGQSSQLGEVLKFFQNPLIAGYVTLAGIGFVLFVSGMNTAASTSLSREGKTFWISKLIPVSPEHQVLAKFLNGYALSMIGVTVTVLILGIFMNMSPIRVLLIFIFGAIGSVTLVAADLMFDVFHPKLIWTNPQEAIKQNLNAVLGMLAAVIFIAFLAVISVPLISIGVSEWLVYGLLFVVMSISAIVSYKLLMILAARRYPGIES